MLDFQVENTGVFVQNKEILRFTLRNKNEMQVQLLNYGGIISSIKMPDKNGIVSEVTLGFNDVATYISDKYLAHYPYFGCIAGRYANRIGGASFRLNDQVYHVSKNAGNNCLHGGYQGFDKKIWDAEAFGSASSSGVVLKYFSPHLEEGFPGNLHVKAVINLTAKNALCIHFEAVSDHDTPLNLTNHCYFNFNGCVDDVLNHELQIDSSKIVETRQLIPTGKLLDVVGTAFDFRSAKKIGRDFKLLSEGYDNSFVIAQKKNLPQAILSEKTTGRRMKLFSDQPVIQLYTGHYIPQITGHDGKCYSKYMGLALEAQQFPDAPNHPGFPSAILKKGQKKQVSICYQFKWETD